MKLGLRKRGAKKPQARSPQHSDFFPLRRILVPIDFSEHSKNAFRYAVPFAKQFGAELILVYVVEPPVYPADFSFGQVALPDFEKELYEQGKAELDDLTKEIAGETKVRAFIRTGKPFLEIIGAAEEEDVDLIIIATHGHTGVEHLLFGSTAEKVIRKAGCPVLVVRGRNGGVAASAEGE